MKVLVTGGTGFLGKPLVERLVADGHDVIVLTRKRSSLKGAVSIEADFTDKTSLEKAKKEAGEIDALLHLGALVYKKPDEDVADAMTQVNALGTTYVLDVLGKEAKIVVYGSTAEIYGLPETSGLIREDLRPQPASNYGATKLAGEYLANVWSSRNNVPVVNLRFSVMYGAPDPIARAIPNFIKKAIRNEPLEIFGGEELRDYLHVHDAVEAVVCALEASKGGTYNVGSGKGTSVKDAAAAIVKRAKSTSALTILPRQKKASDLVLDISALQKDLNFKAMYTFPQGLDDQLAWERQQA